MSDVIKIRKGLDIQLKGSATKRILEVTADKIALKPPDFAGVFPKLLVNEGDAVKAGSPVFYDKYRDNILFASPVSGRIAEIFRGPKRKILEIRIEADGKNERIDFGISDPKTLDREAIIDKLLKSGVWSYIRQRPYSIVADPQHKPKAIFISAFDTAPLGVDYDLIVDGKEKEFQAGVNALQKLTPGKVHLNVRDNLSKSRAFLDAAGVQVNRFSGPHPTGNVGIQIHHLDPINKGDVVWYLDPQAVVILGRLFLEGHYRPEKVVALAGSEVSDPHYYRIPAGASVYSMVRDQVKNHQVRFISGNVLTGQQIEKDGYLGYYHNQITVIPEGKYHEFLGWALPRLNKFSYSRTFFSWLFPARQYQLDTNLNGGHRAFVLTGEYEKVFPMDIYPLQLLKAILVKDIDLMENLGIYEVDEEDFALCEFIDASKTEMQAIVREGLDFIRKEME